MSSIILKVGTNREMDIQMALEFYSSQERGIGLNLWKGALEIFPVLSELDNIDDKEEYLNRFVNNVYEENKQDIEERVNHIEKIYKSKQENFFKITDRIFQNEEQQIEINTLNCWPSIFQFNPRFLKLKAFQVCMWFPDEPKLQVIFHEMLHFLFYGYINQHFPDTLGQMETEGGKLWDLAEIFNTVIQSTNEFTDLHGKLSGSGYPVHQHILPEAHKIWNEGKNLDKWIEEVFAII